MAGAFVKHNKPQKLLSCAIYLFITVMLLNVKSARPHRFNSKGPVAQPVLPPNAPLSSQQRTTSSHLGGKFAYQFSPCRSIVFAQQNQVCPSRLEENHQNGVSAGYKASQARPWSAPSEPGPTPRQPNMATVIQSKVILPVSTGHQRISHFAPTTRKLQVNLLPAKEPRLASYKISPAHSPFAISSTPILVKHSYSPTPFKKVPATPLPAPVMQIRQAVQPQFVLRQSRPSPEPIRIIKHEWPQFQKHNLFRLVKEPAPFSQQFRQFQPGAHSIIHPIHAIPPRTIQHNTFGKTTLGQLQKAAPVFNITKQVIRQSKSEEVQTDPVGNFDELSLLHQFQRFLQQRRLKSENEQTKGEEESISNQVYTRTEQEEQEPALSPAMAEWVRAKKEARQQRQSKRKQFSLQDN